MEVLGIWGTLLLIVICLIGVEISRVEQRVRGRETP